MGGRFLFKEKIMEITVIINCYKRLDYLDEQIEAIKNQSVKPTDIWIWYNQPEGEGHHSIKHDNIIYSTKNFKFHARFALALLAKTKYVAIFDDDTIPGKDWFKNCLDSIKRFDGIYGTTGVIYQSNQYLPNVKVGWNGYKNPEIAQVDLVGHAWFFKKEHLKYMFYEEPLTWDTGEDIQFSTLAYKYGGIKTFVPPHTNKDEWGSIKGDLGNDEYATWLTDPKQPNLRNQLVTQYIKDGYTPVVKRNTL